MYTKTVYKGGYMSNYVNISCPVVYHGRHYEGVSIAAGVTMDFEVMPCVANKTRIVLGNTAVSVNIFVELISSVEEFATPCRDYLVVAKA